MKCWVTVGFGSALSGLAKVPTGCGLSSGGGGSSGLFSSASTGFFRLFSLVWVMVGFFAGSSVPPAPTGLGFVVICSAWFWVSFLGLVFMVGVSAVLFSSASTDLDLGTSWWGCGCVSSGVTGAILFSLVLVLAGWAGVFAGSSVPPATSGLGFLEFCSAWLMVSSLGAKSNCPAWLHCSSAWHIFLASPCSRGVHGFCSPWPLLHTWLLLGLACFSCGLAFSSAWLLCGSARPAFLALPGSGGVQVFWSPWPLLHNRLLWGLACFSCLLCSCSAWSWATGYVPMLVDVNNGVHLMLFWTDTHLGTAPVIVGDCTDLVRW